MVINKEKTGEGTRIKATQNLVFWWFKDPNLTYSIIIIIIPNTKAGKTDTEFINLFYF